MTSPETVPVVDEPASPSGGEQAKPRSKRNQNKRANRSGESNEQARPRPRGDRFSASVYGDGIERAFCTEMRTALPRSFPVNHRNGIAVINPIQVAREPGKVLLCDCQHSGPHGWPNGDVVEQPLLPHASATGSEQRT